MRLKKREEINILWKLLPSWICVEQEYGLEQKMLLDFLPLNTQNFIFGKKKISIKSQEIFTNDEFWKLYQINKWKYFGDEDRVDSSRFMCRNWTNFRTENLLKNLHLLNFCWYRTKLFFVSSRKMPCKNWKLQKLEGDFLESNTYLNFSCMGVLKNSVNFSMET